MEKKKLDTKAIRKYWWKVIKRAWKSASDEAGMKLLIIGLIIVLLVVALAGLLAAIGLVSIPFFAFQVGNVQAGLDDFCGSVALLVFLFLAMLWRTPAEMHQEKEDRINELEPENAKIEIVDPPLSDYTKGYRIKLRVINKSIFDVIKCHAKLDFIIYNRSDNTGWQEPKEWHMKDLLWSSRTTEQDGTITISGNGGEETLDIIEVGDDQFNILFNNNGPQVGFDWPDKGLTASGLYLINVKIYGNVGEKSNKPILPIETKFIVNFKMLILNPMGVSFAPAPDGIDIIPTACVQIRKVEIHANTENQEKGDKKDKPS